jgi:hypothetical protein
MNENERTRTFSWRRRGIAKHERMDYLLAVIRGELAGLRANEHYHQICG